MEIKKSGRCGLSWTWDQSHFMFLARIHETDDNTMNSLHGNSFLRATWQRTGARQSFRPRRLTAPKQVKDDK